jgi:hypothetical protein
LDGHDRAQGDGVAASNAASSMALKVMAKNC